MFLSLNHKKLDVYQVARELVAECYRTINALPGDEKYNIASQIKRAAMSVKLNIAEGASRKSEVERKRFYEIARGSVIEIDCALEAAVYLGFLSEESLQKVGVLLNRCFSMLCRMVSSK